MLAWHILWKKDDERDNAPVHHSVVSAPQKKTSAFFNSTLLKQFINGYYINLAHRTDRRSKMESRLLKLNANIQRLTATGPTELNGELKDWHLTRAQRATVTSHYQGIKQAAEKKLPYVLILEDDVVFCEDINEQLAHFLKVVPCDWKMLYLGISEAKPFVPVNGFCKRIVEGYGAYGYIVHSDLYPMLLSMLAHPTTTVDDMIAKLIFPYFPCYVSIPTLCYVEDDYSDIAGHDRSLGYLRKHYKSEARPQIPRIIHQIWLGDQNQRPQEMMDTWKALYPDFQYILWTEENLPSLFSSKQYQQVLEHNYSYKPVLKYCGLSDILRYELLFRFGGIFIDADAVATKRMPDEFFECESWAVFENEISRPGMIANGYMASIPGGRFITKLVQQLSLIENAASDDPWKVIGTRFVTDTFYKYFPFETKIFPSHYFIPEHFTGVKYGGSETPYARQYWGSTRNNYDKLKELKF